MKKRLLSDKSFLKWCNSGITKITLKDTKTAETLKPYAKIEKEWGNKILNKENSKQWSTKLCENSVEELLYELGFKDVETPKSIKSKFTGKSYKPDFLTEDYIWEVKGRSWTTTGTAGEKILGTPTKYSELPLLYKKPLIIILVGYQEYEAREGFACGNILNESGNSNFKKILNLYKDLNVFFIGFTELLDKDKSDIKKMLQ